MRELTSFTRRNIKLFFKDKGLFFTSLITPVILLVLYITFLARVFRESFNVSMPDFTPEKLVNASVAAQLISSLLAVCCVTVAFCSNMLMVQDKISGVSRDISVTPVKRSVLSAGYYLASFATTLIICVFTLVIGLLYIASCGWYMSISDVLYLLLDVFLLTMMGTALSSIINCFLSTQGQISAVGTIVSSGYGFICGAYMPMSMFPEGLTKVLSFLPGTYATALIRTHAFAGPAREMIKIGYPADVVERIKDSIDSNIYFFGNKVGVGQMYLVLGGAVAVFVAAYILINVISGKRAKKNS